MKGELRPGSCRRQQAPGEPLLIQSLKFLNLNPRSLNRRLKPLNQLPNETGYVIQIKR
jgi:hypothetical protein